MGTFSRAIVRRPARSLIEGITSSPELGLPDYDLALKQHDDYIAALEVCGLEVTVLEALEDYPDSCFTEDTAVLTKKCAIITNPGAESRRAEAHLMLPTIQAFFSEDQIEYIVSPGLVEGGDVMMIEDYFYIGRSARTNEAGAKQFIDLLSLYGYEGSTIPVNDVLHLKTGVTYVGDNTVLTSGEFIGLEEFTGMREIAVPPAEEYAVNCIKINDRLVVPAGYPKTEAALRDAGFDIVTVDTSEYKKIDGGLTCLSLRF